MRLISIPLSLHPAPAPVFDKQGLGRLVRSWSENLSTKSTADRPDRLTAGNTALMCACARACERARSDGQTVRCQSLSSKRGREKRGLRPARSPDRRLTGGQELNMGGLCGGARARAPQAANSQNEKNQGVGAGVRGGVERAAVERSAQAFEKAGLSASRPADQGSAGATRPRRGGTPGFRAARTRAPVPACFGTLRGVSANWQPREPGSGLAGWGR